MLIAQITDLHLGFDPDDPAEFNRRRLDMALRDLREMDRPPDILFVTGDLSDRGDAQSYRRLRRALAPCPFPVCLAVGNHDVRAALLSAFPETPGHGGFIQYVVDAGPLRFIVLDTLEEGRHGGAFCAERADWLRARLGEAPERPTIVILHHPPIDTGIDWMTTHVDEPWVARLAAAIQGHRQIVGMIAGHIHRPIVAGWRGLPLIICPSTAPQVALNLAAMDADRPDGRPMIVADPPGYALHWWNGQALVSHFESAEEHVVLARYDARMQPLVEAMMEERPSA